MTAAEPGYRAPDISLIGEEHVLRYEETAGRVGHIWNAATVLVLTTTGRKSGQARKSALIYARDGADYLVVASQGGAPTHPNWYHNIVDHPSVTIQVRDRVIPARARAAVPDERPRLWAIVNEQWPNYAVYETRTTRLIPVVVLTPSGEGEIVEPSW